MKGHDADGFVWFTDRRGRKGAELAANPRAALVLEWGALGRQVRAEGASRRSATRPRGSTTARGRAAPRSAHGHHTSRR